MIITKFVVLFITVLIGLSFVNSLSLKGRFKIIKNHYTNRLFERNTETVYSKRNIHMSNINEHDFESIQDIPQLKFEDILSIITEDNCDKLTEVIKQGRMKDIDISKDNTRTSIFVKACELSALKCVKVLLDNNVNFYHYNEQRLDPITAACLKGDLELIKLILNSKLFKEKSVAPTDDYQWHIFNCFKYPEILENTNVTTILLDQINNIDYTDSDDHTLLHLACMNGPVSLVYDLLKRGANINSHMQFEEDMDALYYAVNRCHSGIVKLLLEWGYNTTTTNTTTTTNNDDDNDTRNSKSCIPMNRIEESIVFAAYYHDNTEVIRILTQYSTDYDILLQAFHKAIINNKVEIAEYLINRGVNVNDKYNNISPLSRIRPGSTRVPYTPSDGDQPNFYPKEATVYSDTALSTQKSDCPSKNQIVHPRMLVLLLNNGAYLGDGEGSNALYIHAIELHLQGVHTLLAYGVNIDVICDNGSTLLLDLITQYKYYKLNLHVITFLLQRGINTNIAHKHTGKTLFILPYLYSIIILYYTIVCLVYYYTILLYYIYYTLYISYYCTYIILHIYYIYYTMHILYYILLYIYYYTYIILLYR